MKQFSSWAQKYTGLLIILIFLVIHLTIINNYGFTWDFHFHFFGGGKLLGYEWWQIEPRPLPYVEPDPRRAWTLPYGPLMSIPPVASFLIFHKTLGWLAADNAYHLPIIFWGVAGIGILYAFMREAFGWRIAVLSSLFLALSPRFFGDLHNNMKDVPNAAIFALNMWLLWRLVRYRRFKDLLLAAAAFAVAFNVKVNSIFIPIIFAAWLIILFFSKLPKLKTLSSKLFLYFILAPLTAFLLWWVFWPDPVGQLKHAWLTFGVGTNNIEVLLNGNWYCSGKNVPWYYPYWYLAVTTPLPILFFFLISVIGAVRRVFLSPSLEKLGVNRAEVHPERAKRVEGLGGDAKNIIPTSALMILWLIIPLTRYFITTIGVIDGIRHFEEVLFPIAALSAIGLDSILRLFSNNLTIQQYNNSWRKWIVWMIVSGIMGYLSWNIVAYHPYQITYFNELVGGVKGAFGKYDLDYWGTSQKAAVQWVNDHAPQNARVHIIMAAAVAGQYLRPDLLPNLNKYNYDESDFVVLLNRQSFFYRFFYAYEYLLHHKPTQTITVRGVPLVWIYDNRTDNRTPRQTPWWQDEDPCIIKYWRGEHQ